MRWAGTKTRIGDSDDEGVQEEEKDTSGGEEGSEVAAVEGIVIVPPKRGAAEAVAGAEVEANPGRFSTLTNLLLFFCLRQAVQWHRWTAQDKE